MPLLRRQPPGRAYANLGRHRQQAQLSTRAALYDFDEYLWTEDDDDDDYSFSASATELPNSASFQQAWARGLQQACSLMYMPAIGAGKTCQQSALRWVTVFCRFCRMSQPVRANSH